MMGKMLIADNLEQRTRPHTLSSGLCDLSQGLTGAGRAGWSPSHLLVSNISKSEPSLLSRGEPGAKNLLN